MERIKVLIDKLVAQNDMGESAQKILMTVHLIQQELIKRDDAANDFSTNKVAVVMPMRLPAAVFVQDEKVEEEPPIAKSFFQIPENDKRFVPSEDVKPALPSYKELLKEAVADPEPYLLRKPVVEPAPPPFREVHKEFFPLDESSYDEVPTLVQHTAREKELHELIAVTSESLNDRLKGATPEVAHRISAEPIKDLRKGIALNDKFVFINELFRGDDVMYDRSIKTINGFHALPEAEYWMNRELKVKLGWSDNKDTVQHFYAVVRRRFS